MKTFIKYIIAFFLPLIVGNLWFIIKIKEPNLDDFIIGTVALSLLFAYLSIVVSLVLPPKNYKTFIYSTCILVPSLQIAGILLLPDSIICLDYSFGATKTVNIHFYIALVSSIIGVTSGVIAVLKPEREIKEFIKKYPIKFEIFLFNNVSKWRYVKRHRTTYNDVNSDTDIITKNDYILRYLGEKKLYIALPEIIKSLKEENDLEYFETTSPKGLFEGPIIRNPADELEKYKKIKKLCKDKLLELSVDDKINIGLGEYDPTYVVINPRWIDERHGVPVQTYNKKPSKLLNNNNNGYIDYETMYNYLTIFTSRIVKGNGSDWDTYFKSKKSSTRLIIRHPDGYLYSVDC